MQTSNRSLTVRIRPAAVVTLGIVMGIGHLVATPAATAQRGPKVDEQSIDVQCVLDWRDPLTVSFEVVNAAELRLSVDRWSFGDGADSTEVRPVHRYASAGVFDVQVWLREGGKRTTKASRSLNLQTLPRIEIVGHGRTLPETQRQFWFEATGSRSNGTPVGADAIEWTFPDGSVATGLRVGHTFAADGDASVVASLRSGGGLVVTDTLQVEVGNECYHGFEGESFGSSGDVALTTTDPTRVQTGESALLVGLGAAEYTTENVPTPILEATSLVMLSRESHLAAGVLTDHTLTIDFSRLQDVVVDSVTGGHIELSDAEQERIPGLVKAFSEGAPEPVRIVSGAWRCIRLDILDSPDSGLARWTLRIDGQVVVDVEGVSFERDATLLHKLLPRILASDVVEVGGGEWIAIDDLWAATVTIECP